MYQIDENDSVIELRDVPQSDTGAPCPAVIAGEHQLSLVYIISEPDLNWDGSYATIIGPGSKNEPIALLSFVGPYAHMFGPPNDEAFSAHPLASRGLQPYSAWEVKNSSWVRIVEPMNSAHPYHRKGSFDDLRHLIFAFHDSTFECLARDYRVSIERGSVSSIAAAVAASWT